MNDYSGKKFLLSVIIIAIVIWLHKTIGNNVFSFAPAPFILSIAIVYLAKNEFKFIFLLAVISELLSFLPIGIMTMALLIPWLVRHFTKKIAPDLSPYFIGIVSLIISVQTTLVFGSEILYLLFKQRIYISQIIDILPYTTFVMIVGVSTLVASTICIAWREIFPLHQSGSTTFTRRKKSI